MSFSIKPEKPAEFANLVMSSQVWPCSREVTSSPLSPLKMIM